MFVCRNHNYTPDQLGGSLGKCATTTTSCSYLKAETLDIYLLSFFTYIFVCASRWVTRA